MSTYAWVLLAALTPPVVLSFDEKVAFYKKWKYLLPATMLAAIIFVVWDAIFTSKGIWGFNPDHILGIYIFDLPLEEIIFFIAVPYACIFTYEVYMSYSGYLLSLRLTSMVSGLLVLTGLLIFFLFNSKAYPAVTFLAGAIFIAFLQFFARVQWLRGFYIAWLIMLAPFCIVNGILTGSFIEGEVVWYNKSESMGIRLGTIPVEDFMYGLLLLLLVTSMYEWLKKKY
jgi:lycopene cyclase domain-containing protein